MASVKIFSLAVKVRRKSHWVARSCLALLLGPTTSSPVSRDSRQPLMPTDVSEADSQYDQSTGYAVRPYPLWQDAD